MDSIAQKLEALIRNHGVTKVELASSIGLTSQTIANILNGADAKVSSIQKIAAYFGIPAGYLVDEVPLQSTKGNSNIVVGRDNNGNITMAECQNQLDDALKEVKHLKEVIDAKDKLLQEKERLINVLMGNK